MEKLEQLKANDGVTLWQRQYLTDAPRAAIILVHGMTEHSGRYGQFARFLCNEGINVYCHDQRGHGLTGENHHDLGHLPFKLGGYLLVDDIAKIISEIRKEWEGPLFLLGHSMGSFVSRRFAQQNQGLIDGLILSGTGAYPGKAAEIGRALAAAACRVAGAKKPSPFLQKMTFSTFNRFFKPVRTEFDWLCRDKEVIDSYIVDPYCGFTCTNGFYHELYDLNLTVNAPDSDKYVDKDLPILLFSGDRDPVGAMGQGVEKVKQHYLAAGVKDVQIILYPEGRHEMLKELNQADVYHDILHWINNHLQ